MKPIILTTLIVFTFLLLISSTQSARNKDLEFSNEEQAAIVKLRHLVKGVKYDAWIKSDWSLMHYLRAKNLDTSAAATALRETIRWRQDNRIESILDENVLDLSPPFNTEATAKDGSPVMLWLPARWDVRKVLLAGNRDKIIRYFDQMSESALNRIRKIQTQGGNATQWVQILDLTNYNLRQHACANCFPTYFVWVSHWEKHYPGAHQHFIYINTPRIFQPLLNLLKPLYSVPTRNALKVLGVDKAEWQPELLNLIAADELPKVVGGKKKNWF